MASKSSNKMDPARTVLALFTMQKRSGVTVVSRALNRDYSSVYRWQLPRHMHGLDGKIPGKYFTPLRQLATEKGFELPWEMLTGESQNHTDS